MAEPRSPTRSSAIATCDGCAERKPIALIVGDAYLCEGCAAEHQAEQTIRIERDAYRAALERIRAYMGWARPDHWKVAEAKKITEATLSGASEVHDDA